MARQAAASTTSCMLLYLKHPSQGQASARRILQCQICGSCQAWSTQKVHLARHTPKHTACSITNLLTAFPTQTPTQEEQRPCLQTRDRETPVQAGLRILQPFHHRKGMPTPDRLPRGCHSRCSGALWVASWVCQPGVTSPLSCTAKLHCCQILVQVLTHLLRPACSPAPSQRARG